MVQDPALIRIYYQNGSYSLEDVYNLVLIGVITETDFFHITRLNFKGVTKIKGWDE